MEQKQIVSPAPTGQTAHVTLDDGRRLSYQEYGDRSGAAIFFQTGTSFSRLLPGNVSVPTGIRLVSIDRAGIGQSDEVEKRSFAQSAADLNFLADKLGLDTYALLGWSSGASHAMECAAHSGKRVRRLGLVAPLPPPMRKSATRDMDFNWAMIIRFGNLGTQYSIMRPIVISQTGKTMQNPDKLAKLLSCNAADARTVTKHRESIRASYDEATRNGAEGIVNDVMALFQPWDYEVKSISAETIVWHGNQDNICPHGADYVLGTIPGSRQVTFPQEGHMALLDHWTDILKEMAPYTNPV